MGSSTLKRCSTCKQDKDVTCFHKSKCQKDGLANVCKSCSSEYYKRYYTNNKTHVLDRTTKWYKDNRQLKTGWKQNWHRLRTYGISNEDWLAMYMAQQGVCAICGKPETRISNKSGKVQPLCIDHRHSDGKVRALLCNRCNRVLGYLGDNKTLATKFVEYLSL